MTKTIEEVAKQFAEMKTTKQAGSFVERDKKALLMTQFFQYALEELPLSSRLTKEEKEKINRLYVDVNDKLQTCLNAKSYNQISELDNEYKKGINMGLILALKYIFGKELFGEE